MEKWEKYFIVDTSVNEVRGLKFGRGFIEFLPDGSPNFGHMPENVKLYDKQEDSMADFNKITEKVSIIYILIHQEH